MVCKRVTERFRAPNDYFQTGLCGQKPAVLLQRCDIFQSRLKCTSCRRRRSTVNSFSRCDVFASSSSLALFLLSNEETESKWTASKRVGETFLSLVISHPPQPARPPQRPSHFHTQRYRNLTNSKPLPSRGATAAITETVAAADARFFAPISWVVYRIDVFFFLFSAPTGCDPGEEQPWLPLHSGQSCK